MRIGRSNMIGPVRIWDIQQDSHVTMFGTRQTDGGMQLLIHDGASWLWMPANRYRPLEDRDDLSLAGGRVEANSLREKSPGLYGTECPSCGYAFEVTNPAEVIDCAGRCAECGRGHMLRARFWLEWGE